MSLFRDAVSAKRMRRCVTNLIRPHAPMGLQPSILTADKTGGDLIKTDVKALKVVLNKVELHVANEHAVTPSPGDLFAVLLIREMSGSGWVRSEVQGSSHIG